ncbi:MAG: hypothetical protein HQL77_18895 [Magnetococcales bacterium]|nr:hypothetical protein [Magnetococcales bacterium]
MERPRIQVITQTDAICWSFMRIRFSHQPTGWWSAVIAFSASIDQELFFARHSQLAEVPSNLRLTGQLVSDWFPYNLNQVDKISFEVRCGRYLQGKESFDPQFKTDLMVRLEDAYTKVFEASTHHSTNWFKTLWPGDDEKGAFTLR